MKLLTFTIAFAIMIVLFGRALDHELAYAHEPPVALEQPGMRVQGKTALWWSKRAVQARKDANARGQTIRRLQTGARTRLSYPTGHWLDGAFLCIHRWERGRNGWQTSTGNGYYGGLQMDVAFSQAWGPEWAKQRFGANPAWWPASVQIAAAIHAWTVRGFSPWPSTRKLCGL